MAQHARPHWYTHIEYERPRLSSVVRGLGRRPFPTSPIRAPTSHPPEDALPPGVDQAEQEHADEHAHLDEAGAGVALELRGPREDEDSLDVEQDEEKRKDVVPDLALRPAIADRIDAALIGDVLLRKRPGGAKQASEGEQESHQADGRSHEDGDREVAPQELGHRGGDATTG